MIIHFPLVLKASFGHVTGRVKHGVLSGGLFTFWIVEHLVLLRLFSFKVHSGGGGGELRQPQTRTISFNSRFHSFLPATHRRSISRRLLATVSLTMRIISVINVITFNIKL